jgi:thiamine kinase-like enzyme
MVMPFIQGVHHQELDEKALGILAGHIKTLHATLTCDETPLDLKRMIRSEETAIIEAFEVIADYPQEQAVCHNDLNPLKLIWHDETLCLLDFEYAGMNDRYFDLASVCVEFDLNGEMKEVFLEAYFEGENVSLKKLESYKMIYKALCEEWFQNML